MGGTIASPPDFVQSAPACRRAGLAAQLAPMGILRFLEPLRQEKRLAPLLVMIACIMMGSGLVAPILSLYAQTFGVAGALVGTLITVFGIGRLLANLPSGYLSQRYGRRPLLVGGPLIVAAASVGAECRRAAAPAGGAGVAGHSVMSACGHSGGGGGGGAGSATNF